MGNHRGLAEAHLLLCSFEARNLGSPRNFLSFLFEFFLEFRLLLPDLFWLVAFHHDFVEHSFVVVFVVSLLCYVALRFFVWRLFAEIGLLLGP